MKKYDKYKDSGIEWIGQMPEHWEMKKMKYACNITDGTHYSPETTDEGKPYITVANVYEDAIDVEHAPRISAADFDKLVKQGCQPKVGDVLLAKDGTVGRSAIVVDNNFVALSSLGIISPSRDIESKFLKCTLDSAFLQEQMNAAMAGSALRRITISKIEEFLLFLPPLAEQEAIAAYLDEKTGQIDALMAEKREQLKDLQTLRTSIITEAVTKGLNPNAPMKDSGIEWIGQVPEHWDAPKLRWIVSLRSGSSLSSNDILENGNYVVYGGNGPRGYVNQYTNDGFFALIGRQGALCGNINYAKGKFWATEHAVVCYPKRELDTIWLGETLRAMDLNQYSISAAQPGLAVERINDLRIPLPPLSEQRAIAAYLDEKTSEIDAMKAELTAQIEDLKTLRTSLITEAVTGQVDVRDWKTKH